MISRAFAVEEFKFAKQGCERFTIRRRHGLSAVESQYRLMKRENNLSVALFDDQIWHDGAKQTSGLNSPELPMPDGTTVCETILWVHESNISPELTMQPISQAAIGVADCDERTRRMVGSYVQRDAPFAVHNTGHIGGYFRRQNQWCGFPIVITDASFPCSQPRRLALMTIGLLHDLNASLAARTNGLSRPDNRERSPGLSVSEPFPSIGCAARAAITTRTSSRIDAATRAYSYWRHNVEITRKPHPCQWRRTDVFGYGRKQRKRGWSSLV